VRAIFESRWFRFFVLLYALHQVGHLLLNAQYYFWPVAPFPAPPADGAWSDEMINFFDAMGVIDSLSGLAGLVFVVGYLRRRTWAPWLGLVATSAYLPSIGMFSYGCWASGTWHDNVLLQSTAVVSFIPTLVIFGWLSTAFNREARRSEAGFGGGGS